MFSWANMVIILFLEPRFVKYEKHLLMWKLISDSCTLSRLCFFYRACPSRYPRQQTISARAETEPVFFCKIKLKKHPRRLTVVPPSVSFGTHSSHLSTLSRRRSRGFHKKTLAFSRSFFSLSHFGSHSSHLSSLRHRGEAENLVYFSTISLI